MTLQIVYADRFCDPGPVNGTVAASPANTITISAGYSFFANGQPVYITWNSGANSLLTTAILSQTSSSITLNGSGLPSSGTAVQIWPASVSNGGIADAIGNPCHLRVPYPGRNPDSTQRTALQAHITDGSPWTGEFWNAINGSTDLAQYFWSLPSQGGLVLCPSAASNPATYSYYSVTGMMSTINGYTPGAGVPIAAGVGCRFQVSLPSRFPAFACVLDGVGGVGYGGDYGAPVFGVNVSPGNLGIACILTGSSAGGQLPSLVIPSQPPSYTSVYTTLTFTLICRDLDTDGTPWLECWIEDDSIAHAPYCLARGKYTKYNLAGVSVVPGVQVINNVSVLSGNQFVVLNSIEMFTGGLGTYMDPMTRDSNWNQCLLVSLSTSYPEAVGQVLPGGFVRTAVGDFLNVSYSTADGDFTTAGGGLYKSTDGWSGLHTSAVQLLNGGNPLWQRSGSGPWTCPVPQALYVDPTGQNIIALAENLALTGLVNDITGSDFVFLASSNGGTTWNAGTSGAVIKCHPTPESGYLYGDCRGGGCMLNGTFYVPVGYESINGVYVAISIFAFTPGASTNAVPGSQIPTAAADWTDILHAQPFSGAAISTSSTISSPGQAVWSFAEPTLCTLPTGQLLLAMRTGDFTMFSLGTKSGGTWSFADPWGSGHVMELADGQNGKPLIWNLSYGHSLVGGPTKAYYLTGDAAGAWGSMNRNAIRVYETADGINWNLSSLSSLFRGQEVDYACPFFYGNRLLVCQGRKDNQIRLYTSPQIFLPNTDTDPGSANVATGHNYSFGGATQVASYPTTLATNQAAASTVDGTTLNAVGANTSITFGAGGNAATGTALTAAVYAAGQAAGGGGSGTSGGGNLAMPDGSIAILRGADHRARDGRAWNFADPGVWPSLAGATLTLTLRKIGHNADPAALVLTGSLAAGPPQIVTFEATAAQTGALLPSANAGDYVFEVLATLANHDIFPLIPDGLATVVCNVAGSGLPAGQPVPIAPNVAAQW